MEKEVEKEPDKKNWSKAAIIILVLIVISFIVYIAYDKGYIFKSKQKTNNNNEEQVENVDKKEAVKTESKEELDFDDSRFIKIYNKLASYTYKMNRENGYNSFSDKDLATIAIKDFKESDFTKINEKDEKRNLVYYTYKGDTITKYLKKYFSSDVVVDKNKIKDLSVETNVNFEGSGMETVSYDKDKDEYKVIFAGIGHISGPSPKITDRKIISATKEEDGSIKVVEKAIYYTSNSFNDDMYYNIYSDPANNYYIEGKHYKVSNVNNEKIDVEDYLDKASTITHIFKLDKETNKYYFASSVIR